MKPAPLYPVGRRAYTAIYNRPCPTCNALPGHHCITANGKPSRYAHQSRNAIPHTPAPMGNLREWWRAMRPYEGQHALPRPADLVVP
jgi:hypothetical protein